MVNLRSAVRHTLHHIWVHHLLCTVTTPHRHVHQWHQTGQGPAYVTFDFEPNLGVMSHTISGGLVMKKKKEVCKRSSSVKPNK